MKPVAPLSIPVIASRRLVLVQSVAHCVAIAALLASRIPPWIVAILLVPVGASMARLRRVGPVCGLLLRGDGRLEIVGADGTATEASVHPHTVVLSFMVMLLYREDGRLHALTLFADSLAAEDFRQLRLWLRWRPAATTRA